MSEHITQNLYEASFLMAKGYKIERKEKRGIKTSLVFLDQKIDLDKIALGFYNGEKIEAKLLFDCFRTLKDMIFER